MDVRVDPGPQDGTVLVTWIPVTLNVTAGGKDKTSPVTGYAVFADGKRVTDVDSPSSKIQNLSPFFDPRHPIVCPLHFPYCRVECESPASRLILINVTDYRFSARTVKAGEKPKPLTISEFSPPTWFLSAQTAKNFKFIFVIWHVYDFQNAITKLSNKLNIIKFGEFFYDWYWG